MVHIFNNVAFYKRLSGFIL